MIEDLLLKKEFISLRAKGHSLEKIAKQIGKCRQTLSKWHTELKEEIANAKAIELEELFDECLSTKEHRVKGLSTILSKINFTLESRDFSKVSDDKLVELKLKITNQLKEEYVEPQIKSEKEVQDRRKQKELLDELCEQEN